MLFSNAAVDLEIGVYQGPYKPYSTGLAFNLPGPNSVPYLLFSDQTTSPIDPGPFVFLA